MNVIVTGACGQLGTELRNLSAGGPDKYVFTDIVRLPEEGVELLDITDAKAVEEFISRVKADVIVNCAAYTNVDKAEDDPQGADLLNRAAVANLARCAAKTGAVLIHISTDYVFGGDARLPYREDDPKNPLGVYGRTKLAGESEVEASGCKAIVIRTSWLYSPYGKNFVKTMTALMSSRETKPAERLRAAARSLAAVSPRPETETNGARSCLSPTGRNFSASDSAKLIGAKLKPRR